MWYEAIWSRPPEAGKLGRVAAPFFTVPREKAIVGRESLKLAIEAVIADVPDDAIDFRISLTDIARVC